jgi:hypothetical protein
MNKRRMKKSPEKKLVMRANNQGRAVPAALAFLCHNILRRAK